MKVAIFTDNDFEKINGVTTTLRAVLRHAPAAGISARVYTAAWHPAERDDYVALRSLGMPIPFYSGMAMYVPRLLSYVKRIARDGADVLHLTTPGPVGLAALYVARRLRLPMIGSFHTDLAAYTRLLSGSDRLGALMREYMRWPYSRCQRVLAPSEATRRLLVSSRTNENRTGIWTRGVDADQFSPARRSQALRACWGAPDDVPVLLYVGRVSREKGLDALPPLLDRLRARGVAHRLVVVGDGPLLPELRERCPSAIFTGPVEHDSVPVAFASSDVFLFPSRTDTAGNVVLEAQASGLPVVVAHDGGPRENIRPDRSGFVVRDMGRELADVVALLLRDRSLRTRMAAEARRYALGRSWQVALEPLFDAYRDAALTGAHAGATRREDRHGSNLRAAER